MNDSKIAFIGAGNMATALISGMVSQGIDPHNIIATARSETSREKLRSTLSVATSADNQEAASNADVVVLAVKPQILRDVAKNLAPALNKNKPMVISVAAGIPMASLEQWLGQDLAVVRCMPNTPSLLQLGATGLFANTNVREADKQLAESILSAVGLTAWVEKEADLDAIIALSGSGPAYFFAVIEAMRSIAIEMGLPEALSEQFVKQTALGAARMAMDSDVDVAELRRRVTSPGGTTQAALETFKSNGLHSLFEKSMYAAKDRAAQMAKELGE